MIEAPVSMAPDFSPETLLRGELAEGDTQIGTYAPILRHLLANDEHSVFSDEIVARVRGMMADLAVQISDELAAAADQAPQGPPDHDATFAIVGSLVQNAALLGHCHALAIEWHLTERLQGRIALDPVLSPLLQALIASTDSQTATLAMALLAAQARFAQNQRRMQLAMGELPGDLLHSVLIVLRSHASKAGIADDVAARAEAAIRSRYDEGRSRLGLIARLIAAMGGGATAALSVGHAGVAMFVTALALASRQDRDLAVLATSEGQFARLALSLRAAGLKPQAVEEQFMALFPDVTLPHNFDQIGSDRAAALLAATSPFTGA